MKNKLRRVLPHITIVLCNMYIVFFLIDRVNTAMQFINNSITKALLLILCVLSTVNASFLIRDERRRQAARGNRRVPPRAGGAPAQGHASYACPASVGNRAVRQERREPR